MTSETSAIVGATGATGSEVLAATLKQGNNARIMVRNPDKLEEDVKKNPNLTVIQRVCFADDFQSKAQETIQGADYVISTVGGRMGKKNDFPVGKVLKYVQDLTDVMKIRHRSRVSLTNLAPFLPIPMGLIH